MRAKKSLFQQYGQQNIELGFGQSYAEGNKRLLNKDGTFNINRVNTVRHIYVDLVKMSWKKFFFYVGCFYAIINILFGSIYFLQGTSAIHINQAHPVVYRYFECISFSVQTLATVGYGVLNPDTFGANLVSSIESLFGILIFAIMTGLCYTRFSKPTAGYKFSDQALITPYKKMNSLQVRVANNRNSNIVEIEATMILGIDVDDGGMNKRIFLNLPLERNKIYYLPLSWTIVHPITPDSPLYNKTFDDLKVSNAELMVMLKAHDDAYAQTIHGNTSYIADEMIWGAKFVSSYYTGKNGMATFEMDKLGHYTAVDLNIVEEITETSSL